MDIDAEGEGVRHALAQSELRPPPDGMQKGAEEEGEEEGQEEEGEKLEPQQQHQQPMDAAVGEAEAEEPESPAD